MGSIAIEEQPTIGKPTFPTEANTLEYAQSLDAKDHMRSFREKFIIPSKSNLKTTKVVKAGSLHPRLCPSISHHMISHDITKREHSILTTSQMPQTHAYISAVTLLDFNPAPSKNICKSTSTHGRQSVSMDISESSKTLLYPNGNFLPNMSPNNKPTLSEHLPQKSQPWEH